jgi:hypothetical protein
MERTKWPDRNKLPDAINRSVYTDEYTKIRNSMIRSTELSLTAKGILNILLSNNEEWVSSIPDLKNKVLESEKIIKRGIKELKQKGYLQLVRYRDVQTKQMRGLFWAYTDTPFVFDYHKNVEILKNLGFEVVNIKPTQLIDNHPGEPNRKGGNGIPKNIILKKEKKSSADRSAPKTKTNSSKEQNLPRSIKMVDQCYDRQNNGRYRSRETGPFGEYEWKDSDEIADYLSRHPNEFNFKHRN